MRTVNEVKIRVQVERLRVEVNPKLDVLVREDASMSSIISRNSGNIANFKIEANIKFGDLNTSVQTNEIASQRLKQKEAETTEIISNTQEIIRTNRGHVEHLEETVGSQQDSFDQELLEVNSRLHLISESINSKVSNQDFVERNDINDRSLQLFKEEILKTMSDQEDSIKTFQNLVQSDKEWFDENKTSVEHLKNEIEGQLGMLNDSVDVSRLDLNDQFLALSERFNDLRSEMIHLRVKNEELEREVKNLKAQMSEKDIRFSDVIELFKEVQDYLDFDEDEENELSSIRSDIKVLNLLSQDDKQTISNMTLSNLYNRLESLLKRENEISAPTSQQQTLFNEEQDQLDFGEEEYQQDLGEEDDVYYYESDEDFSDFQG